MKSDIIILNERGIKMKYIKFLITATAVSLISNASARETVLIVGEGYNIIANNQSDEIRKLEITDGANVQASVELSQKSRSEFLFKNLDLAKFIRIKDMSGNELNKCEIDTTKLNSKTNKRNNVYQIFIGASSCTKLLAKDLPVTNKGTIIYQGTNFLAYNQSRQPVKYTIMHNKLDLGFVNLPSHGIATFALNLAPNNNTGNKHVSLMFGNNNKSTTSTDCYISSEFGVDDSTNFYSLAYWLNNRVERCIFSHDKRPVTQPQTPENCKTLPHPGVDWTSCHKERQVFTSNSKMEKSILRYAFLDEGFVLDGDFRNADLSYIDLYKGSIIGRSSGYRTRWGNPISTFDGVDASDSVLDHVRLGGWLENINFTDATLANVTAARDTILSKSNFTGADVKGIQLPNIVAHETKFNNLKSADNANFENSDLYKADYTGANLDNANFTGAKVAEAKFNNLKSADNVNFTNTELYKAEFNDANLNNANFIGVKAHEAKFNNLKSANKTKFRQADLVSANFINARAAGAIFQDSELRNSSFRDAFLQGVTFEGNVIAVKVPHMLRTMNLNGADFSCGAIYNLKFLEYDQAGNEIRKFFTKAEVEKILADAHAKLDGAYIYGERKSTKPGERCVNGRLQAK